MTNDEILLLLDKIESGALPSDAELSFLASVTKLYCKRTRIPDSIIYLTGLKHLDLSRSRYPVERIKALPESLWLLKNLESLSLAGTHIQSIPENIGKLKNLKYLNLKDTDIFYLPESLEQLHSLQWLDLSGTNLKTINTKQVTLQLDQQKHADVCKIYSLNCLILNDMAHLIEISDDICNLRALRQLELRHLRCSLPYSIGELSKLASLDLSKSTISSIPESIGRLTGLKSLILKDSTIKSFPISIEKLTQLQKLDISGSDIASLPESIGSLSNLRVLDASHSSLKALPKSITRLNMLTRLDIHNTPVTALPSDIGSCKMLEYLDLSSTEIAALPDNLLYLNNLSSLSLSHTRIDRIWENIDELINLMFLDLSYSRVKKLPNSIGNLKNLRYLILEFMKIDYFPNSLVNLNIVFISNRYRRIGYLYHGESQPEGIYIYGICLRDQPEEIFFKNGNLISDYLKSNDRFPVNECKVVFLGKGNAGKSLTLDRIINDGYISDDFRGDSTPGISIRTRIFSINGEDIEVHFWDFGGQAIMNSMHRMFLTKRTLYVIFVNARNDEQNQEAQEWIRTVKSFTEDAPVIIFITHKDVSPYAAVNTDILNYKSIKGVYLISSLYDNAEEFNKNVTDSICKVISEMPTVHELFPANWKRLMSNLKEMENDYITSDAFYKKCNDYEINPDEDTRDVLIDWFQDLGVCFYSRKHPASTKYMVLKPKWMLNALYVIVIYGRRYSKNGIIKLNDIYRLIGEADKDSTRRVLPNISYNLDEIQYIVNVIVNFELMYCIDYYTFFVPMLCNQKESITVSDFIKGSTYIHVYYKYEYLTINIFYRLMVRMFYDLVMDHVWREGALFERKTCGWKALVRVIESECKIEVFVKATQGNLHHGGTYLSLFRDSILSISKEFGQKCTEYIVVEENDLHEEFKYDDLIGSMNNGIQALYSANLRRVVHIDQILGLIDSKESETINEVIEILLSVLSEMSNKSAELRNMKENELTSYLVTAIKPLLNSKYNIQIEKEAPLGLSRERIGRADMYFYTEKDGIRKDLYILENKIIDNFIVQYGQLIGYLNQNFQCGITLSINKKKGWEEAFDYISTALDKLKSQDDDYAPIYIERIYGTKMTKYIRSEHIVKETDRKMSIYHLVLQLSSENRHSMAKKIRNK